MCLLTDDQFSEIDLFDCLPDKDSLLTCHSNHYIKLWKLDGSFNLICSLKIKIENDDLYSSWIIGRVNRKHCLLTYQIYSVDRDLHLMDIISGRVIKKLHHKYPPRTFEFDEEQNLLFVYCQNCLFVTWNVDSVLEDPNPKPIKVLPIRSDLTYHTTMSMIRDNILLSSKLNNNVRIFPKKIFK